MDTSQYYDEQYYGKEQRHNSFGWNPSTVKEREFILQYLNKFNPSKVMDLGCSIGHFAAFFKSKGFDVTGVDISSKIIEVAKKENPLIPFYYHDMSKASFGKFDFIYSLQVIEHIFDLDVFLKNVRDSLNSGGVLILTTPNVLAPRIRLNMLLGKDFTFRDLAHIRFFSASHLREIVEKNGFSIIELSGSGKLSSLSVNLCGNLLLAAKKN